MRDLETGTRGYTWIQGDSNFTSLGSLYKAIQVFNFRTYLNLATHPSEKKGQYTKT